METSKCLRGDLPAGSRAIRRRGARESNDADGDARPDQAALAGNSHLPPNVVEIMTKGASIELERAIRAREVPQYPFASPAARAEASIEADRAIATGHMSYVPADEVETSQCLSPRR